MPRPLVGQPPAHLIDALAEALRPLVRLSLAKGLTYPVVADLVRELFVAVGRHEFLEGDQAGMQSRLSVLTGIHRREIKRLAADTPEKSKATTSATRGGELVSRWTSTRPFIDAKGKPLPLPRLFSDGGRRSFEALVTSFSSDVRPRAMLDQLVRLGVVTIDAADRVCLNVESFVPARGVEEKAFYFGQNIGDHIAAATANLLGATPSFPDRSVYRDELSPASIQKLRRRAERLAMNALHTVNRDAAKLEPVDKGAGQATHRLNFGFYIYNAPMEPLSSAASTARPKKKTRSSKTADAKKMTEA